MGEALFGLTGSEVSVYHDGEGTKEQSSSWHCGQEAEKRDSQGTQEGGQGKTDPLRQPQSLTSSTPPLTSYYVATMLHIINPSGADPSVA